MENQNRISYIDVARGIAAFLVVLGHVLDKGQIRQMIYQVHMPLFFILAGMLLKLEDRRFTLKQLIAQIRKRARVCLIPYVIWGLFYSKLRIERLWKLMYGTREMLIEIKSLSSLWFLPVMFAASVISEGIIWMLRKSNKVFFGILLYVFLLFVLGFSFPHISPYGWPFGLDIAFVGAAFMLLGVFVREYFSKYVQNGNMCIWLFFAMSAMFLFVILNQWKPIQVSMHDAEYGNAILFVFYALLGTMVILLFSLGLDQIVLLRKMMCCVGRNTLGILVTHRLFLKCIMGFLPPKYKFMDSNLIFAIGLAILATVFSIMITKFILYIDPILVGKSKN